MDKFAVGGPLTCFSRRATLIQHVCCSSTTKYSTARWACCQYLPYGVGVSDVEATVPQQRRPLSFSPLGIRLARVTDPASAVTALTPLTAVRVSLAQHIRDVVRLGSAMPHELSLVTAKFKCWLFLSHRQCRGCLYLTIHGYAVVNTTFFVGTAATMQHTALLST